MSLKVTKEMLLKTLVENHPDGPWIREDGKVKFRANEIVLVPVAGHVELRAYWNSALVWTDRIPYQTGQTLHFRGITVINEVLGVEV